MTNSNECIICCKDIQIFARGQCDHPVCFICMTRIRALCNQNECPICRNVLEKVIFSPEQKGFNDFLQDASKYEYNDFYKIYFTTSDCQNKFINLLSNKCNLCPDRVLPSFDALQYHVRKEHHLFFCDLCVSHIKLFPWERIMYSRKDYATHRRTGDKGLSSMKGHPLCEYCDTRFFDKDTLYRHLRTEHYFCHICDAEGSNDFYAELPSLRGHFREKHFLCEEDDCAQEHFTSVFRSEIDLKAHKALCHARKMTKEESKSMRNIELNFQMFSRNRSTALDSSDTVTNSSNQSKRVNIDATNEAEFPSLDPSLKKINNLASVATSATVAKKFNRSNLTINQENFPALSPISNNGIVENVVERPVASLTNVIKKNSNMQENTKLKTDSFASKKSHFESKKQKSQINSKVSSEDDFPLLPYNDLHKNLNISIQKKTVPLLEYSSLAKVEPKINIVKKDELHKDKTKKLQFHNLNLNSDLSFPVLEKKGVSKMNLKIENNVSSNVENNRTQKNKNSKKATSIASADSIFNKQNLDPQNGNINHYNYIDPPNEVIRNQQLKQKIYKTVNNKDTFNEFTLASKMFIINEYSPSTYFEHCRMVLGETFIQLFPELIVLLPNIKKQRELFEVLSNTDNVSRKILTRLNSCSVCGQIYLSSEGDYHKKQHDLNEVFPALS